MKISGGIILEKDFMIKENELSFYIRNAEEKDWDEAMELAFQTFLKYEAKEYGQEGIKNFSTFVTDSMLKKLFLIGEYKLFLAEWNHEIIGLISLRSGNHISLLFVDEKYHRLGVGSALVSYLQDYILRNSSFLKITVNAAPYGIPFYHHIGFKDMGPLTQKDGISFIPMEFYL